MKRNTQKSLISKLVVGAGALLMGTLNACPGGNVFVTGPERYVSCYNRVPITGQIVPVYSESACEHIRDSPRYIPP